KNNPRISNSQYFVSVK
ncbi:unnamed protein product, partial [Allacma fusca]